MKQRNQEVVGTRQFSQLSLTNGSQLRFFASDGSNTPVLSNNDGLDKEWKIHILQDGAGIAIQTSTTQTQPSTLAASWLWMHDPEFIHSTSGQKLRTFGQYSPRHHRIVEATYTIMNDPVELKKLHPTPPPGSFHPRGGVYDASMASSSSQRQLLHVRWADGTTSWYDCHWLLQFYNGHSSNSSNTRVTKDIAIGSASNPLAVPIPTLDYNYIMEADDGRWDALHGIFRHGALLIKNSPIHIDPNGFETDVAVADMAKRLSGGRLSHGSLYGDTFRVESQPNAQNIAYTSVALPPHQDLTYYESKPFLQLLQCVSNASKGGASVLIDAMAAVEWLRVIAPSIFDTLCKVEATFIKQRPGADMVSFKPHIVLSSSNQEVVEVNWSPPFEGPPMVGTTVQDMQDYIHAYQAMECLLNFNSREDRIDGDDRTIGELLDPTLKEQLQAYAKDYTWESVLHPGDMIVFNNQRMCHGRRAFELVETHPHRQQRHLIGCYTDAMETINEYRLLLRTKGHPLSRHDNHHHQLQQKGIKNAGNGTRGTRF